MNFEKVAQSHAKELNISIREMGNKLAGALFLGLGLIALSIKKKR